MSRLSATLVNAFNLRTAVVLFALWLLLGAAAPDWFNRAADHLDRSVFRLALYASDLPVPRTLITVVHVPEAEYEGWLDDFSGADGLHKILQVLTDPEASSKPLVGIVLERPLILAPSNAETLLAQIHKKQRRSDPLHADVKQLLERREYLLKQLPSEQVILGLLNQLPPQFPTVEVGLGEFARLPEWLRSWLEQEPDAETNTSSYPQLPYLPILLNDSAKQYLVLRDQQKYLPTFWAEFLAAQAVEKPSTEIQALSEAKFWRRYPALASGPNGEPLNPDAGFVPIYGPMSGIRASLQQLTLEAALVAKNLGDWVLIGRNSDEGLEQAAQILASVGDHAFLTEPRWWPTLQKYQLFLSAVLLCLFMSLASWRSAGVLLITLLLATLTIQVIGQSLFAFWLPCGELLSYDLLAFGVLCVWRWQRSIIASIIARADSASLVLSRSLTNKGDLDRAFQFAVSCRNSPKALEQLYQIGLGYEAVGHFTKAWKSLRELKRRKRNYKDVLTKLKRIKLLALSQSVEPSLPVTETASQNAPKPK